MSHASSKQFFRCKERDGQELNIIAINYVQWTHVTCAGGHIHLAITLWQDGIIVLMDASRDGYGRGCRSHCLCGARWWAALHGIGRGKTQFCTDCTNKWTVITWIHHCKWTSHTHVCSTPCWMNVRMSQFHNTSHYAVSPLHANETAWILNYSLIFSTSTPNQT